MIGLAYIRKLHKMTMETLSAKLDTTKQNVNLWENSASRKIPTKYLPLLASIFDTREEYFQKELTKEEEINLQIGKLKNEIDDSTIEYESPAYDEISGEVILIPQTHYDEGAVDALEALRTEKHATRLMEKVKAAIYNVTKHGFDPQSGEDNFDTYNSYIRSNIRLIDRMIDIANCETIQGNFLKEIIRAIEVLKDTPSKEASNIEDECETTQRIFAMLSQCYQQELERQRAWSAEINRMLQNKEDGDDDLF